MAGVKSIVPKTIDPGDSVTNNSQLLPTCLTVGPVKFRGWDGVASGETIPSVT